MGRREQYLIRIMTFRSFMAILLLCILVCLVTGKQLEVKTERSNAKLIGPNLYPNPHSLKDEAIKLAIMKELLKLLGMKHRPAPIPLEKRKQNIPRPVYDGGIGSVSPEVEQDKQTQVIIAAEEDNEQSLVNASPCFKFKLKHTLLSNHIIEYATLHVYNEADVDNTDGIYKTIHLKEARDNAFQGGLLQDEKMSIRVHKKTGAQFVDSSETGHFILRDGEVIQDPVSDKSSKTSFSKEGQHEKEAKRSTDSTEDNDQASGYTETRKDSGSFEKLVTMENELDDVNDRNKNQKEGGRSEKIYEDLLSSKVYLQTKEWFEVHVREMIEKWAHRYKDKTHTLKIECEDCGAQLKICKRPKYRPFLVLKLTEKKQRRKRRSDEDYCATGYDKCCRRKLYINFKDIGWHDWIIEPAGYEVNYCEGRCKGTGVIPGRSHVFVKQEMAKSHSYLNICCVPVKFYSLTILHYDNDGNILQKTLPNMTVRKCECV